MIRKNLIMVIGLAISIFLIAGPVWSAEKDKEDATKAKTVKPTQTTSKPATTASQPSSKDKVQPATNKFDKEKEYEQNHKKRVAKIEQDYNSKITQKQKQIKDQQQATSASGKGVKDDTKKKTDKLNQDIDKLNKEKKQKIDDSRDTMQRQKDALWKK